METSTSTSTSHEATKRGKAMKSDTPIQRQLLIPSLPDELSLEILTRIPIKPLIRFTIVSKPWNLLITSPHFTKSHLSTSLSNPLHSHHYLLHSSARPNFTLHQTPLNPILPNIIESGNYPVVSGIEQQQMVLESHSINHPMQRPDESLWLVGSINGLVCLALDENEIIFWNPCLGKHRRVPRLEVKIKRGCFILYGFGYDAVGEDYKVVSIFCVFKESNVYENEVMVYSGKSDSWKTIEGFKDGVPLNDSGKFVNGKLHWATSPGFHSTNGGKSKWSIVSIDVGDESWGELDQPNYGEGKYDLVLGVLGEWICVLCNDGQSHVDVWVMKEYGVKESWTKFASISSLNGPVSGSYEPPLFLLNNGKILLMFGPNLVLYNSKDDSRRFLDISDFHACIEALVYFESLVLP